MLTMRCGQQVVNKRYRFRNSLDYALVLQGGGGLGACPAGAYAVLAEQQHHPRGD